MDKTQSLAKNPKAMALLKKLAEQGWRDQKIQDALTQEFKCEWNIQTIRRNRKKMGVIKCESGKLDENRPTLSIPPPGLEDHEKAGWFREQFIKSHLFVELKSQFHVPEIQSYMEEYGDVCCQFEDIVTSEFFQIDDYLKHRILINRQLKLMKDLQFQVSEVVQWISSHPFDAQELEMEDHKRKELNRERVEQARRLDDLRNAMKAANDRYDKLCDARQKIMSNLAATRKDRQEELRGGKDTFFQLVSNLQSSAAEREKQGRYAKLTELAAKDIKKAFRKPVEFPDGISRPIILDEHTDFEEEE
ncbi:MAG TPA: hypothetical protein ENH82_05445 [bacterium]|nr:hypothetical protein [bacterium]